MQAHLPLLASLARPPAAGQRPGWRLHLPHVRRGQAAPCDATHIRRPAAAASPTTTAQAAADLQPAAVPLAAATTAAHKELNRRLVAAAGEGSPAQLLALVEAELREFNAVNATTAFHRLAKCAAALPPGQRDALRAHPAVRRLASSLERSVASLGDVQAAQVLWAHAQLGHASPALLDALYVRLGSAHLLAAGSAGSDCSASGSDGGTQGREATGVPPLVLADTSAACNLAWAQAKLRRPQPELLQRLVAALLAAEAAADEQQQQQQQQQQGAAHGAGSHAGSSDSSGVCLAACDGRALCLLAWSLASLGACPPRLLAAITAPARAAPGGLAALGLHSLCNLLTAHAAVVEAQAGGLPWDQQLADDVAAVLAAGGAQQGRPPARRGGAPQAPEPQQGRGRQQARGARGQQLNEADCSILVRCLAAAWQEAAVASGADTGNRLKLSAAVRRHVAALPARGAAARVLAASALRLAPGLSVRAVSALAHAFASLGGAPPALLDALAARAVALEGCLDVTGVANLAWAFSTLQHDHPQLFEALAREALRLLRQEAQEAGDAAGSAAGSGVDDHSAGGSGAASRQGFNAQAVSVAAFSFASANRCDSPAQREMMAALAARAEALLPQLTPQGLANLAWALTVAGVYPPALVRRWRTVAGGAAGAFRPPELHQLHLVEVALRLEAPDIGLDIPAEARSFFDSLYQAGRLRAFAGRAWRVHQEAGPRSVSDFQLQVYRTIRALGADCVLEHSEAGEYSIDVAVPRHRIAVEVDGPVHFAANSRHLMGGTALKRRLLRRLGWRVVAVPFYEWWQLAPGQRQRYMRAKLAAAGLDASPPTTPTAAPAVEAEPADGDEQQAGQQQQLPPKKAAPVRQPAAAHTPHPGAGEPAAPAPHGGNGSGVPAGPAGLAQRAQRLAMLQHHQGKLTKQGLLGRSALAATGPGGKAGGSGGGSPAAPDGSSAAEPGSGGCSTPSS